MSVEEDKTSLFEYYLDKSKVNGDWYYRQAAAESGAEDYINGQDEGEAPLGAQW